MFVLEIKWRIYFLTKLHCIYMIIDTASANLQHYKRSFAELVKFCEILVDTIQQWVSKHELIVNLGIGPKSLFVTKLASNLYVGLFCVL